LTDNARSHSDVIFGVQEISRDLYLVELAITLTETDIRFMPL